MLTLTSPSQTWAHDLPAGAKLAALCLWTTLLFQLSLPMLIVAALCTAALPLSCGAPFAATSARMLRPLWPFVLIVALWHLWLAEPHQGSTIILRMVTTVAAANFVTMTTRLSAMIAVLTRVTRPLAHLGLKPGRLALAVALMIRFLPVLLLKADLIRDAFRARARRRPGWRLLPPLLLAALDDAETVAEALRARGGAG